ncbi:MAG: OmpA family protein [Zoogloeaceae bacterium]|nr:OmpA family protein [Zoogloeaceae bacterium]
MPSTCRPLIYLSLLLCAACDTLPSQPTPTEAPPAVTHSAPATHAAPVHTPPPAAIPAPTPSETTASPTPEAVYILQAEKNNPLPDSVEQSLRDIAERMQTHRDFVIRLESYVPNSGSREMNIGLSRQAVASIRRRLVELGVPSYRIKQSLLGAEHPDATRLDQRRVELFMLPLPR